MIREMRSLEIEADRLLDEIEERMDADNGDEDSEVQVWGRYFGRCFQICWGKWRRRRRRRNKSASVSGVFVEAIDTFGCEARWFLPEDVPSNNGFACTLLVVHGL